MTLWDASSQHVANLFLREIFDQLITSQQHFIKLDFSTESNHLQHN